eukprot:TRINITY_DN5499_c0_g1_i1.p1 TRINITY_DN5499_c0_g1~~TRINITY_DN5499_c0_g1_i1.p1  ORF type:complete len:138 (+),score=10.48 TRINITY_DN5499_c0_g1_i1:130-543(+)
MTDTDQTWMKYFSKQKVVAVEFAKGKGLEEFAKNAFGPQVATKGSDSITVSKRIHFSVNQNVLDTLTLKLSSGTMKIKKQNFFEFIHDTKNFDLLNRGCWLIRRVYKEEVTWTLRRVQKLGDDAADLEFFEVRSDSF